MNFFYFYILLKKKYFKAFTTMIHNYIDIFIDNAIGEDIGDGDHTSLSTIPDTAQGKAKLLVKENGILSGVEIAKKVFAKVDSNLTVHTLIDDGAEIKVGDVAFFVEGRVISILTAERLVLNIMQRMSGIATQTKRYAQAVEGTNCKVLDTRKTTPGMRILEKLAVKAGGGENHRMGLHDMILIKDNHVDFAGGIENAIDSAINYLKLKEKHLKIEIEVRNFDEINRVLAKGGVNRIMLDNFSVENTRKAVELINKRYEIESSGGITLETIGEYAQTGVDFISVGALTHQIKSLDLSLKAVN